MNNFLSRPLRIDPAIAGLCIIAILLFGISVFPQSSLQQNLLITDLTQLYD